jgi:hypothetical protein
MTIYVYKTLSANALFKALCIAILLLSVNPAFSQNFLWAKDAGGSSSDIANSIAVDASGNCYVTGWFKSTATFGSSTISSAGAYDFYLAKYDASGNFQWVKNGGSTGNDIGYSVTTDNSGNVYVAGTFNTSITLGSTTLSGSSGPNIFVAKYDNTGNLTWARSGTSAEAQAQALTVDAAGNIYLTGYFKNTLSFGTYNITGAGGTAGSSIFIAKIDAGGNVMWLSQNNAGSQGNAYGIACDASGNVYTTGYFLGSIGFGSTTLSGMGLFDVYITKLDGSGNFVWAKSAGGGNVDQGNAVAVDPAGNIYVYGYYTETCTFDNITLNSDSLSADVFLAKYAPDGTLIWAKSAGGTQVDIAGGMDIDDSARIYVSGYFQGTTHFGASTTTSKGMFDAFVAKFDSSGNTLGLMSGGGSSDDISYGLKCRAGNVYLTGSFKNTATFGSNNITSAGLDDIFIAKIDKIVSSSSRVNIIAHVQSIEIFPNPAKDQITVNLKNNITNNVVYTLYSSTGETVGSGKLGINKTIDLSNIPAGSYFLSLNAAEKTYIATIYLTR